MELDKLEISLRRRTSWEAIDLGFALARRWFIPLWLLWITVAVPLSIGFFLFFHDQFWLLMLIIWWFKPLYEPPLIFWLSRAVFGESLPVKTVLRQWWSVVRPQLLLNLTLRRFNSARSFTLPVALLEGLWGQPRRQRLRVLSRNQHAATWLSIVGIHFEAVLQIAFMSTVFMLIPEDLRWVSFSDLLFTPGRIGDWLQLIGLLLCLSMIAPFYVAAGFVLYLNRRSELEAWDIEISFRRTGERIKAASTNSLRRGAMLLLMAALILIFPLISQPTVAASSISAAEAKPVIEKVLQEEAFGQLKEVHSWRYIAPLTTTESDEEKGGLLEWLEWLFNRESLEGVAALGKVVVWGAGISLVVFLLYRVFRYRPWLQGLQRVSAQKDKTMPVELFGLDLRPECLPADPAAEAQKLIIQGAYREALSLLYRGALVSLVTQQYLEIPESATEGECEALIRAHRSVAEAEYFNHLTRHWLQLAYGHIVPAEPAVLALCQRWQEVYGHVDS